MRVYIEIFTVVTLVSVLVPLLFPSIFGDGEDHEE